MGNFAAAPRAGDAAIRIDIEEAQKIRWKQTSEIAHQLIDIHLRHGITRVCAVDGSYQEKTGEAAYGWYFDNGVGGTQMNAGGGAGYEARTEEIDRDSTAVGGRGGAACDREPSSLNAPTRAGADDLVRGWPLRCWVPCSKPQPSTLGSTRRRRPPQAATRRLLRAARGGLPTLTVDRPRRAPVRVVRKMCFAHSYYVVISQRQTYLYHFARRARCAGAKNCTPWHASPRAPLRGGVGHFRLALP